MTASHQRTREPSPHERTLSVTAIGLAVVALGLATFALLNGREAPRPDITEPGREAAAVATDQGLRAQLATLQMRLSQLETGMGRREAVDTISIRSLVEQALAERRPADQAAKPAGDASALDPTGKATAVGMAAELMQTPFGPKRDELWQRLQKMGGVDEAVAYFEQLAAAEPGSADAQTNLGAAYIQQLLQTTDEQQRMEIGKKIDAQFDQALELQPDHWEARFRKAVGLSYGPALSGRQTEAIAQFERLIGQQANQAPVAGHEQSYLYLGRLYAQRGDTQRAREIWLQGLTRFPRDDQLRQLTQ